MASLQERLDECKIDRTYPGQWTITFTNPPINMFCSHNDRRYAACMAVEQAGAELPM
jgi:hypothetical protein